MSRAIDKDVIASLANADHAAVFRDISHALLHIEEQQLLEIEILGRSHPLTPGQNLLQDENAIGVPKLRLIQAFFVARQIFRQHLAASASDTTVAPEKINAATAVLLLFDAEHLTAANLRKRALTSALSTNGDNKALLAREKRFVDSLLTSRLHRHTKSPTLWSHRRWLLDQYRKNDLPVDVLADMQIIMTSGERHPRNYYAWGHARWLTTTFRDVLGNADRRTSLWNAVVAWCFAHHDDISGWAFLDFLVTENLTGDDAAPPAAFLKTLDLASRFQWTNESVWWYLRTTAARSQLSAEHYDRFETVYRELLGIVEGGSSGRDAVVLANAWRWFEQNRLKRAVVSGG